MTDSMRSLSRIRYQDFKKLRDDYRNNRQARIPRPLISVTVDAHGDPLRRHSSLREPLDLLWVPTDLQRPGVTDRFQRKAMSHALSARFVLFFPQSARDLPVTLCAGIEDSTEKEISARICNLIEVINLPEVPRGAKYWVGLRVDAPIPDGRWRDVRALVLSAATQKREDGGPHE